MARNKAETHETEETRTFAQLHDYHTGVHPQQEAFVIYDEDGLRQSYTFQDTKDQSLKIAAALLQIGIDKGQNVALMAPNSIEFIWCYLALNRIGANAILIPASGKTEEEVMAMLERCMCKALMFHPGTCDDFDQRLIENAKSLLGEDKAILIGQLKTPTVQEINYGEVYKRQEGIHADDPAVCMFSSGSTGDPKAIQYSHRAVVNHFLEFVKHCFGAASSLDPVENPCRLFQDRPFSWSGGLLMGLYQVFAMGSTVVSCCPKRSIATDPELLIRILQDENCSGAYLTTRQTHDLIANGKIKLNNLKCIVDADRGLAVPILMKLRSVFPNNSTFVNMYGLSEICPIAVEITRFHGKNSVSFETGMTVCPPMEVKVINDNGQVVDSEERGEICAKTPYQFREYLGDPRATSARVDSSGWVHTGDVGYIDQQGKLHVCGRKSEVIINRGVEVFASDVENVLSSYPDIKAVAVIGVPDGREGEEICACVVPKTGSRLESSVVELEEWATHQWKAGCTGPTHKPKYTLVMEAFPSTNTGKIDRKALKTLALRKLSMCN